MNKIKVLIVDDKRIIGDLFNFALGDHGHHITFVNNPLEALDLVRREQFDIAFLDIIMPQKDGISLLKELKVVAPQLPVVMMSGFMVEEQRQRARALGAVTCLNKPFEREELQEAIKAAIGIEI